MQTDNVEYLPIWKKGATAEEHLLELAMIARKHPERFSKVIIIYHEQIDDREPRVSHTRYTTHGCDTTQAVGLIELGKLQLLRYTHDF